MDVSRVNRRDAGIVNREVFAAEWSNLRFSGNSQELSINLILLSRETLGAEALETKGNVKAPWINNRVLNEAEIHFAPWRGSERVVILPNRRDGQSGKKRSI